MAPFLDSRWYTSTNVAALYAAAGGPSDAYEVNSESPPVVADFAGVLNSGTEYYRVGGVDSDFASMFTFSRASSATQTNSSGNLVSVSSGVARRNHYRWNGSSYVNKGILLESEERTNLITTSNDFNTGGFWTVNGNSLVTNNSATGPDGTSSAALLQDDNGGGTGSIGVFAVRAVSTSTTYTFSVFAKSNTLSWLYMRAQQYTTPSDGGCYFDLSSGTVGTADTGFTGRIESYGGGWYRCSITFTTDASDTSGLIVINAADANGDNTVDLDDTSSIYLYGAQFELGSTPSSYIPTSGATVTRAAETLSIAGANMSASTTAMSFHHQGEINYADEGAAAQQTFWRWQTDASNYLSVDLDTDSTDTGEVNANQADGGTVDTVTSDSYSPGINVTFNIATRNTNGAINLAVGGTAVTEDSTPTSLNDASSDTFQLGYDMMGTHALFRQWAADIGDTGIESATS